MRALSRQPLKWQAITELLISTGARRGEILGLQWNDIDFKNNRINNENNAILLNIEFTLRILLKLRTEH